MLGSPEAADGVARMARVIRGSRTLQVREREILGELTDGPGRAESPQETGAAPGRVEPWLAAHAVLGLYASLLELARDRVLAGVGGPELGRPSCSTGAGGGWPCCSSAWPVTPSGAERSRTTAGRAAAAPQRSSAAAVAGDAGFRVNSATATM